MPDTNFSFLEQAYAERSVDPELDSLRSEPRFQNLVHHMNLPREFDAKSG